MVEKQLFAVPPPVSRCGSPSQEDTAGKKYPGYLDTEPLPATSAVWKYKGIFRKDDQRVGLWSDVAAIPVG